MRSPVSLIVPESQWRTEIGMEFTYCVVAGVPFWATYPGRVKRMQSVVCECECGEYFATPVAPLIGKRTKSCGCKRGCMLKPPPTIHGASKTKLYKNFVAMIGRCHNPKHQFWKLYGQKGITVAAEWHDFEVFKAWAMANGYDENDARSLDRIDPLKSYGPDNCQWLTVRQNSAKVWTDMAKRTAALESRIAKLESANVAILCVLVSIANNAASR